MKPKVNGWRTDQIENTFCPFCRTLVAEYRPAVSRRTMSFECPNCGALYNVRFEDFPKNMPVSGEEVADNG